MLAIAIVGVVAFIFGLFLSLVLSFALADNNLFDWRRQHRARLYLRAALVEIANMPPGNDHASYAVGALGADAARR